MYMHVYDVCAYVRMCTLLLLSDCKEPFTGNFTFEVPRSSGSTVMSVGSVTSPYQMYFR